MTKTIVWIEDDVDIIAALVRPLERAGYTFLEYRTANEALNAIDQLRAADLILLDMILQPGTNNHTFGRYPGLDILRALRDVHHIKTPVIALTVVTRDEVLEQLRELGVADIIRKPIRPTELKSRVERILASETS